MYDVLALSTSVQGMALMRLPNGTYYLITSH
jgi:hypothetical protein